MTEIQQARDALAKWRADGGNWFISSAAHLMVGTAGNPELLDAIDGFLAATEIGAAQSFKSYPGFAYAVRIAAAIVAADERISA